MQAFYFSSKSTVPVHSKHNSRQNGVFLHSPGAFFDMKQLSIFGRSANAVCLSCFGSFLVECHFFGTCSGSFLHQFDACTRSVRTRRVIEYESWHTICRCVFSWSDFCATWATLRATKNILTAEFKLQCTQTWTQHTPGRIHKNWYIARWQIDLTPVYSQ